jgi:hypothetical protein
VLALQAAKDRDPTVLLKTVHTASPGIGIGAVLTLLSGIGLVLQSEVWRFSMIWIVAGIAMILVAGATEGTFFSKKLKAIQSMLDETGPDTPEIAVLLQKIATVATVINVLFFVVIWLMVFKLG